MDKTLNKIIRKGHDYVAQVKGSTKELLKWIDYNSSISEPIDEHISTYLKLILGRYLLTLIKSSIFIT